MSVDVAPLLSDTAVPSLARGVRLHDDKVRSRMVLLAPERAIMLDPIAVAIVTTMDGKRSIAEIAATLAAEYAAPLDVIAHDVGAFIRDLSDRRLIEVAS